MKREIKRDILLFALLGSLSACQSGPLPLAPEILSRQSGVAASGALKSGQQVRLADLPTAVTDSSGATSSNHAQTPVQTRYPSDNYQYLYRGGNTPPGASAAYGNDEAFSHQAPAPAPRGLTAQPMSESAVTSAAVQYPYFYSNRRVTRVPFRNRIIVLMPASETKQGR